jgi:hypothetical protein
MMGAYVTFLLEKGGLSSCTNLAMGTLVGYINSATECLRHHFRLFHDCLSNGSLARSEYIAALLHQRRTWKKPKDQKEPMSSDMLRAMNTLARQAINSSSAGYLSQDPCLFDCICLAVFTGSRLGEYGQSNLRKDDGTDAFDPIPDNYNIPPEFRGKPFAFILSDFQF